MPIRSVTSRFHKAALAALILQTAAPSPLAQAQTTAPPEQLQLSLPKARAMAIEAVRQGEPRLALGLARGLQQAAPRDPMLHFIEAAALEQINQPDLGRQAAARAYRFSKNPADKFRSSQYAAKLSFAADSPTLAQIWLRRSANHAPDAKAEEQIARDYRVLRQKNPFAFRFRSSITPSSNVNGGTDAALELIDGIPTGGVFSPRAQALSGLQATLDFVATYRLASSKTRATTIGGRLYSQSVSLSSSARANAPGTKGEEFNTVYGEVSLRHSFAVGPAEKRGSAYGDLALGSAYFGGSKNYDLVRATGSRSWRLTGGTVLELNASAEDRFDSRYSVNDARVYGLGASVSRPLANGDQVNLAVNLRDTRAKHGNGNFQSATLRAYYGIGKALGPTRWSLGLTYGIADYESYQVGLFRVPGGREDASVYGDINVSFDNVGYAGFVPTLRLRAGQKSSNVNRFDTSEVSLSLGFESKF